MGILATGKSPAVSAVAHDGERVEPGPPLERPRHVQMQHLPQRHHAHARDGLARHRHEETVLRLEDLVPVDAVHLVKREAGAVRYRPVDAVADALPPGGIWNVIHASPVRREGYLLFLS